ncbi:MULTISPECIES: CheB methylesterase domain-containing protein [Salipiger]|jgi:two-component system chemotaxis response regulator CheB|uniref:protein-glutamate methylesterase n=1 Tax=Salipiger profundus TaxID=1229727 RepID=A0A1U7D0H1_9RHOB|nr:MULTISPECIES: CheB methylesterase domain-containing protein [Salipiger]APX21649.1 CheB methylesterase [Salipiger profundus]GGA00895.1 chemotaxis response regulator protein-glutamate methylesterase of group 1 operon [Salipiger profundus]SFC11946.1 CheB methylesterase [Salipiger profundus]
MTSITLVVAIPDPRLRRRLAQELITSAQVEVVGETHDLMSTYAEVEEREPMAVLIAGRLARQPEFEVMRALFAALDVRWIVISEDPDTGARDAGSPWGRTSDLFAVPSDISSHLLIDSLCSLTRNARRSSRPVPGPPPTEAPIGQTAGNNGNRFILIGASTGGVDALLKVLAAFPVDCPPTFVVQHTGAGFGESLTRLLDRQCAAAVRSARDGDTVGHGKIVVAAGCGAHLRLGGGSPMRIRLARDAPVSGHMPSVDVLFQSAIPGAKRAVAALLTGMGRDGAEGLKALRDSGAITIAQDQATSTVYGMPRAATELGAVQSSLPLQEIGPAILRACATPHTVPRQRMPHR